MGVAQIGFDWRSVYVSFRADNPNLTSDDLALLGRLQSDERMPTAWDAVLRREGGRKAVFPLLLLIVEMHSRAPHVGQFKAGRQARIDRRTELLSHVQALREYFGELSTTVEPGAAPSIVAHAKQIEILQTGLAWGEDYIRQAHTLELELYESWTTTSQKAKPAVAFSVLLCQAVEMYCGSPLYRFVSTVTEVAFGRNDIISEEAVRQAYMGHKRRTVGPSPPAANDLGASEA